MATFLLKKSYLLKNLKEVKFHDLWDEHGIFTTMWVFGRPLKILFFNNHIKNLVNSLREYQIRDKYLKRNILKVIDKNLSKKINYNHLLRVAINKKMISISLRKRFSPKLNFELKLINFKRHKPEYKNLKYKKILSYLSTIDNTKSDIGLVNEKKVLETGTSNLFFIKGNRVFTPKKNYYKGNTFKFFKTKINNITKKDILVNEIKEYDEVLLIGSGKGVASVKTINKINWQRKSLKYFKILSNHYKIATKQCRKYKF